jgi:hypothetical protein
MRKTATINQSGIELVFTGVISFPTFFLFHLYSFGTELEPDGFFASGPVRPASKFVQPGPVKIRPDHF